MKMAGDILLDFAHLLAVVEKEDTSWVPNHLGDDVEEIDTLQLLNTTKDCGDIAVFTETGAEKLHAFFAEIFGDILVHSLVVYLHASRFETPKARLQFISAIINGIHVTDQFWIKTTGGVSPQDDDSMVAEMLNQLSYRKETNNHFSPNELHICDVGPLVLTAIRDYHHRRNNAAQAISNLDLLSIHLGCQYLPSGCHQRHEWTLRHISELASIFKPTNDHTALTRIKLRIHPGALVKRDKETHQSPSVSQIFSVLESIDVTVLALVGFQTPPDCGNLLVGFLQRNHSVESLLPIWKPSGLSDREKRTIQELGELNRDMKRFLREQSTISSSSSGGEQRRTQQLDPKHWSPFLAKVSAQSPSKLFYFLQEGGILILIPLHPLISLDCRVFP
jgi:hypothetical protein